MTTFCIVFLHDVPPLAAFLSPWGAVQTHINQGAGALLHVITMEAFSGESIVPWTPIGWPAAESKEKEE